MSASDGSCYHIYAGGKDGGKRGQRCARPEAQHCSGAHDRSAASDHAIGDPCAGVHHMFMRRPICGLFQVTLGRSTFGVEVVDGFVKTAAPIAKWCIGQPWEVAREWFQAKGGRPERVRQ